MRGEANDPGTIVQRQGRGFEQVVRRLDVERGLFDFVLRAGNGDHHGHEVDIGTEFAAVPRGSHEIGHDVVGADAERRDMLGQLYSSIADMVEQGLVSMRKPDKAGEPEGTAATLDRVDGAEHCVQPIAGAIALLYRGELLLKFEQQLGALIEIGGLEVVEVAQVTNPSGFTVGVLQKI